MSRKAIEAYLSGQSFREIATWIKPSVAHSTIQRYMRTKVDPIIGQADKLKDLLSHNNDETKELPCATPSATVSATPSAIVKTEVREAAVGAILGARFLTIRENRVAAKHDRLRRLQMIVEARALDMADVPGGASGFLTRDYKGSGDNLREVAKFDEALFRAFSEEEKAIAIELGQWQENVSAGVSIQIICPSAPDVARMPEIRSTPDEDIIEGEFADIGLMQHR